jgi:hypothetical protein
MKELAIGETGLVDGVLVKCVEWDTLGVGCRGCAFYNDVSDCGIDCPCTADKRKDKKDVMFISSDSCTWTEDPDGIWYTSCGQAHEFTTGTPEENDHRYCPYCGKVLDVSR